MYRSAFAIIAAWLAASSVVRSQPPPPTSPSAESAAWRFRDARRPVKVVVLAGSIGAFAGKSYIAHLSDMCEAAEFKNLSKTGLGTWALRQRFQQQVLQNRRIDWQASGGQRWLLFGGGLNSIGSPERNNREVRELTLLAHRRGFQVVLFSVTPWGDERDRRWRQAEALKYRTATQKVVDYAMGRLSPADALGIYRKGRGNLAENAWSAEELPNAAVDLYDSSLRARNAAPWTVEKAQRQLRLDPNWQRQLRALPTEQQATRLQRDIETLTTLPQWFMRPELRGFDHIHPNSAGHAEIARSACPYLPTSWNCRCPSRAVNADAPNDHGVNADPTRMPPERAQRAPIPHPP